MRNWRWPREMKYSPTRSTLDALWRKEGNAWSLDLIFMYRFIRDTTFLRLHRTLELKRTTIMWKVSRFLRLLDVSKLTFLRQCLLFQFGFIVKQVSAVNVLVTIWQWCFKQKNYKYRIWMGLLVDILLHQDGRFSCWMECRKEGGGVVPQRCQHSLCSTSAL